MARKDEAPEDRDQQPLLLSSLLDCENCEMTFDEVFQAPDGVFEVEDLIDPPSKEVVCPSCGHDWVAEYGGWHEHESAG